MTKSEGSDEPIDTCSPEPSLLISAMYLRNEFDFRNVHGIMNTSGLLQMLTLQETRSILDSMNNPKIESFAYINI